MIRFGEREKNQFLINPRWPDDEKKVLVELKSEFEKRSGAHGYFFIASSGSSRRAGESAKLVVLSQRSVLNSALRVSQYLNATAEDAWGLVLPEYHVAGLGVRARAHLAGAPVHQQEWEIFKFLSFLDTNKIAFVSLVPTQISDIVQAQLRCPASLKQVFVGAATLTQELKNKARSLGWPIAETYGMTETCSMIAVKNEEEFFRPLPGVQLRVQSTLEIQCDSILTAILQMSGKQFSMEYFEHEAWYKTQDLAEVTIRSGEQRLKLLGRSDDFIKVLGEGVSLAELRDHLHSAARVLKLSESKFDLVALVDERAGHRLVVVTEGLDTAQVQSLLDAYNQQRRPYEKIKLTVALPSLPRTELGKLKVEEVKSTIEAKLKKGSHGEYQ